MHKLKEYFLIFSLYYLIFHSYFLFLMLYKYYLVNSTLTTLTFYILRKDLPLTFYAINLLSSQNSNLDREKIIRISSRKICYLVIGFLFFLVLFFWPFLNLKWRLLTAIQYLTFAIIYFYILNKKYGDFKSLTLTLILLSLVGLIYELPFESGRHEQIFIHYTYPTIINPRWLYLPILTYEFRNCKIKNKKLMALTTLVWLILWPIKMEQFQRIPTFIFFAIFCLLTKKLQ